jgi:hypothetical protein
MKELPPAFRSIPGGVELVEALSQAFSKHRGWVQATGFVENVELKVAADATDVRRTFHGRFALAHFAGPLGGPYGATLSRMDGDRVEVIAGVLVAARSEGVSALCLSSGADSPIARPETPTAPNEARPAPRPLRGPIPSSFAARVGVTGAPDDDDDEPNRPLPERGDLVEHFAFGICEVLTVTGERIVLRDLRGPGRIREIASDRPSVTGPTEHDGKRLYRLTRKP